MESVAVWSLLPSASLIDLMLDPVDSTSLCYFLWIQETRDDRPTWSLEACPVPSDSTNTGAPVVPVAVASSSSAPTASSASTEGPGSAGFSASGEDESLAKVGSPTTPRANVSEYVRGGVTC